MSAQLLKDKKTALDAKRGELKKYFDDHRNDKGELTMSGEEIKGVNDRNDEITKLAKDLDEYRKLVELDAANGKSLEDNATPRPTVPHGGYDDTNHDQKQIIQVGGQFKKLAYKGGNIQKNTPIPMVDVDIKTLMATGAGFAPQIVRDRPVLLSAQRPIVLLDLVPTRDTTQPAIKYMEETLVTNAAAETAEGGTYQEAALAFTERISNVKKIAVYIPVTDEQLEDVGYIEQYVNDRLGWMLRQRLESQIIRGDGTGNNLTGLLNVPGIQIQPQANDPVTDAIYKAITKIRVGVFALPNAVMMHPNDWMTIRLLRTADGLYIWGNPSENAPERIWGLTVTQSVVLTQGTALVADMSFTELSPYRGIMVEVTNSHVDYFINGKQAIRADMRTAFTEYRPGSVCEVTGIH